MPRILGTVTDDGTTKQTTYTGNVTNNNQNFYFDEKQDGMILTNNGTTTITLTTSGRSYIIGANNSVRVDEKLISFNIMRNSPGSHTFTLTSYLFHNGSGTIPGIPDSSENKFNYIYNTNGDIQTVVEKSKNNLLVSTTTYNYKSNGDVDTSVKVSGSTTLTTQYIYDVNGNLTDTVSTKS